jgi:hypothetical protein
LTNPSSRARLRAGADLTVLDISNTGMLVEGPVRLLPGTRADVHVTTAEGRVLVRCRIVRAWVSQVSADAVRYRAGLAFATNLETAAAGFAIPGGPVSLRAGSGSGYPSK